MSAQQEVLEVEGSKRLKERTSNIEHRTFNIEHLSRHSFNDG
jgi:hypothetical protein